MAGPDTLFCPSEKSLIFLSQHNQANQVGKGEGTTELASKISARKTFRLERPLHALVASLCSCTHVAGTCSCIAGGPGRGVSCDQRMATFAGHIQKQIAFQRLLHVQNTIAPGLRIQKDTMYHVDFPLLQIPSCHHIFLRQLNLVHCHNVCLLWACVVSLSLRLA